MKRVLLILALLLVLSGIGVVVWTATELPPLRMVWSYGFSYHPEPTGQVAPYEGVEFVEIGPGCFRMGSNQNAKGGNRLGRWCARFGLPWGDQPEPSSEMPVHWVEFPWGFWISKYEVTNAQYEAFDPEHERTEYSPGDKDPVVSVSWEDAKRYCAWLSKKSGRAIRLPSESEWECACRAGSEREYCFGDDEMRLCSYAWFKANSHGHAREVGTSRANAWGLHDLHGNVFEWCEDTFHPYYQGAPADGTAWTEGGIQLWGTLRRVYRGGCYEDSGANDCRSAFRLENPPALPDTTCGFRPAFTHPVESE